MAETERIYGWVKEKKFSYPLPSKIKIGSPTEILNQMEHHEKLYIYDETRNNTYDQWKNLQNGSAFRQDKNADDSITLRPIHIVELLHAAEHHLADAVAEIYDFKQIAKKIGEELSELYDVHYCGYYINTSDSEKYIRLLNGKVMPIFWTGDRVCVYLNDNQVDKKKIKEHISIPEDFILRIDDDQDSYFTVTRGFTKRDDLIVVELYRHSYFTVDSRKVNEKRMRQLIQDHNEVYSESPIDENVDLVKFFTKKE